MVNNGKNVSVAEPGDALLMAGAVTESANEEEPLAVEIDLPNKLSINNKYPIRLRRLMSQNTFNIKAAPLANGATIIEMEVVDVEVLNLPRYYGCRVAPRARQNAPMPAMPLILRVEP